MENFKEPEMEVVNLTDETAQSVTGGEGSENKRRCSSPNSAVLTGRHDNASICSSPNAVYFVRTTDPERMCSSPTAFVVSPINDGE